MSEELKDAIVGLREHVLYLSELGVGSLDVTLADDRQPISSGSVSATCGAHLTSPIPDLNSQISNSEVHEPPRPAGSRLAQLPSLKARKPTSFFDKYNPREEGQTAKAVAASGESGLASNLDHASKAVTETIAEIHAEIGPNCTRCKLSQLGRIQVVNSVGNQTAQLMFCGEAPGADEDRLGEPFVGRAGQLLTDIIEKGLELPRKGVFIGNVNRCRPPGNRAPEEDECSVCKPFILREIAVVRPKVIVTLGATATQNLLETKLPIGKLRGKFHDFMDSKVMPTFHPAYLLRDPNKKREVWEDMKLVRDYLRTTENQ
jgi:uracil-DNA glycosylase family 4